MIYSFTIHKLRESIFTLHSLGISLEVSDLIFIEILTLLKTFAEGLHYGRLLSITGGEAISRPQRDSLREPGRFRERVDQQIRMNFCCKFRAKLNFETSSSL